MTDNTMTLKEKPMAEVALQDTNVVQADGASLMEVITRAAKDPDTDVDKLERLMGLYERIESKRAEQAFSDAMAQAQAEMPAVMRDAKNDQTHSKYSRLETIAKTIKPVITKHGFALSFGTDDSPLEKHYRVTCRVTHSGGHSEKYHADVPSDTVGMKGNQNKTATHGFGSTMSYGRRYLTLLIFDIATTEDDDGNAAGGTIPKEQQDELLALLDEVGKSAMDFCKHFGWASIAEIPAKDFSKAKHALETKKQQGPKK